MNRSVWGVVLSVLWLGCGGASGLEEASEPGPAATRQAAVTGPEVFTTVIPPMPPLPALIDLETTPVTRFYPVDVLSAYTVIYPDPSDVRRFRAIGFDVKSAQVHFYVTGRTVPTLDLTRRRLAAELTALGRSSPMASVQECVVGTIVGPRDPVGPGVHDPRGAWRLASVSDVVVQ